MRLQLRSIVAAVAMICASSSFVRALDITVDPAYASKYTAYNLGGVPGLPGYAGGLTLKAGDINTLLIGGYANTSSGAIYQIGIQRDANMHITGFTGSASLYASAPYIDGGLSYAPNGVLMYTTYNSAYTTSPGNNIGQLKPGSTTPDKITNLTGLGVTSSVGGLAFAPDGSMKILEYRSPGDIFTSTLSDDGSGTYNINVNSTPVASFGGRGPEGLAYVPGGSPLFTNPAALMADYYSNQVWVMDIDSNYNPIINTKRLFVTNLTGAEGAFIDPYSGDFVFSEFATPAALIVVQGFTAPVPEPSTYALAAIATGVMATVARRRKATKA